MGGEFTYSKMGSENGVDNHSHMEAQVEALKGELVDFQVIKNRQTNCGWLRNPFRSTVQKPWFLMIPLHIPANNGFNHGFKVVRNGFRPGNEHLREKEGPCPQAFHVGNIGHGFLTSNH